MRWLVALLVVAVAVVGVLVVACTGGGSNTGIANCAPGYRYFPHGGCLFYPDTEIEAAPPMDPCVDAGAPCVCDAGEFCTYGDGLDGGTWTCGAHDLSRCSADSVGALAVCDCSNNPMWACGAPAGASRLWHGCLDSGGN